LRNYYIAGHKKQPRGAHAAGGLGSLALDASFYCTTVTLQQMQYRPVLLP